MKLDLKKLCGYCDEQNCITKNAECILNLIIYESRSKIILYNIPQKRIFVINRGEGIREICFKEAIREIDVIPEEKPEWKRVQILKLAKELGFFGID